MLKKLPLPITGVALGFAALGNLLQSYSEGVRLLCGAVSALLVLLFIAKTIAHFDLFKEDMKNPIMASVFATFPMALMLLAGYARPLVGGAAAVLWYAAIALHVLLILYFTKTFLLGLKLPKVFASWFIVYVGIAAASITAPAFNAAALGTAVFWFALVCLLALLCLVTLRYVKCREIPAPAQPLFCIYTAPASLCLAGYIQSVQNKSILMVRLLAALAFLLYLIVLTRLPRYLKMPFYPSWAAFTFPFVISAIGLKQAMTCLAKMGAPMPVLQYVVLIQTVIAALLTVYTLIRYIQAVTAAQPAK